MVQCCDDVRPFAHRQPFTRTQAARRDARPQQSGIDRKTMPEQGTTWPGTHSIPIPEKTGNIKFYVEAMKKAGAITWEP